MRRELTAQVGADGVLTLTLDPEDANKSVRVVVEMIENGVTVLGLAALDERADPTFDRGIAEQMVGLGAHVGAMTPGEPAERVAGKVR